MMLLKKLGLLVLFLLSISLSQAIDEGAHQKRTEFLQMHVPYGKLKSYESAQQVVSKYPEFAMDAIIELKFALMRLETATTGEIQGMSKDEAKQELDLYYMASCEDFCKRNSGQTQVNFKEAMHSFENDFEKLFTNTILMHNLPPDVLNSELEKARKPLKEALRK